MKNWRNWLVMLALVAYVILLWWWGSLGYPTQVTVCEPSGGTENCNPHYVPVGVVRWVLFQLDRYSVLVTAIATGVIAWFTVSLVRVSNRQAKLTGESVRIADRALTELEAPFLSIKITDTGVPKRTTETGHDFRIIWFSVTNHGRTAARLIELVDKFDLLEDGKDWPREVDPDFATRSTMPYGVIAPPNGESQPFSNNLFAFMMNALAADPLPLKTKNLFFYGFIRYSTIFDEVFRMGFCYMFDRYSDKWLLFGNEKYNYCCKERGPLR